MRNFWYVRVYVPVTGNHDAFDRAAAVVADDAVAGGVVDAVAAADVDEHAWQGCQSLHLQNLACEMSVIS